MYIQNRIKNIMSIFNTNNTEELKWNDKLFTLLPEHTRNQSVTFENIKESLPFQNEEQFLSEILFEPNSPHIGSTL